jgi:phospholipase A1
MAESQPFRETNHEPEFWVQFHNDWSFWGVTNVLNSVGYVHQSNGQGNALSRGWDRIYANFLFEKYGLVVSVKPWIILNDDADSDNPDIGDYMGHGELRASWEKRDNVFSLMLRNQLESGFERGSVELTWSFPVFDYPYLKGYLQYFNGYGLSLIDYDRRVNSLGIGISVTDWLD